MKRSRIHNVRRDKRRFSSTADSVHPKNFRSNPMRGGIRL